MKSIGDFHRWADKYPELGTEPVSIEPCISEDFFNKEVAHVFNKVWLCMGRDDDLPNPGDFITRDIPACEAQILITRGQDGEIRAFHNVCTHRANRLVWDASGCGKVHACKFHGWVFDNQGKIFNIPDRENFFGLDKEKIGLAPIALDTWEGFIFINLDPNPSQTLMEFLGEIPAQFKGFPFDKLDFAYGYAGYLDANWKVGLDSNQEGYHASFLHRRTLGHTYLNEENPCMHSLHVEFFGPHRMISFAGYPHKERPVEKVANKFGWTQARIDNPFIHTYDQPKGINPTRADDWGFDIYAIFPNLLLGGFNGAYQYNIYLPIAVDRLYQEVRMYGLKATTPSQSFAQEYAKCLNRDTWLEDFATLEHSQVVYKSGVRSHFLLQDEEILIRHSFKMLYDYIDRGEKQSKMAAE